MTHERVLIDDWLADDPHFADRDAQRDAYCSYFVKRLQSPRAFAMADVNHQARAIDIGNLQMGAFLQAQPA